MSRSSRPVFIGLVTALLAGLLVTTTAAPAQAGRFTPQPGITTNNPLGGSNAKQQINRKILRSIRATPRGAKIRMASWNIRSNRYVRSLVRAHRRGVSVRVVVARGNANPGNPNRGVNRLQRQLKRYGNNRRRAARKSGLTRCTASCRGPRGIAHTKSFAFSKVGRARWVVINGSHNATELAGTNQWNDIYTTRGRKGVYREFEKVFNQMYRDRWVAQGARFRSFGSLRTIILPWRGKGTRGDPALRDLNRIRCQGARNTGNGRTTIKIAMTAWHGQRGIKIARKVRDLYGRGCNVKIIYAVMGNRILYIMRNGRRGRIPFRQVAQDWNNDGIYDRYLHNKVLTVRGRYGGNRRAWVTVNGSMNWTPAVLGSDEAAMRIYGPRVLKRYHRYIDRWYRDTPAPQYRVNARGLPGSASPIQREVPLGGTVNGVDPYATFQMN